MRLSSFVLVFILLVMNGCGSSLCEDQCQKSVNASIAICNDSADSSYKQLCKDTYTKALSVCLASCG